MDDRTDVFSNASGAGEAVVEAMSPESDKSRLDALVQENVGWLRGWLRGRLRSPETADDLCQESFLRALRSLGELKDPARFPAWLFRIASNVLRDHLRSEARRKARITFTDRMEELEVFSPGSDPGEKEAAERLLEAIRSLPARLREPLLLRHSRSLSYRQIAEILGIRENTVQVRIFRARKILRARFGELKEGPPRESGG